jgi:hypothetical protein
MIRYCWLSSRRAIYVPQHKWHAFGAPGRPAPAGLVQ